MLEIYDLMELDFKFFSLKQNSMNSAMLSVDSMTALPRFFFVLNSSKHAIADAFFFQEFLLKLAAIRDLCVGVRLCGIKVSFIAVIHVEYLLLWC